MGEHGENRRAMLNLIRERQPLSGRQAAEGGGMSLSTAKRQIEELLAEGVVERVAAPGQPGIRGPRAGNLRLRGSYGWCLGLNVEPERIELCAISLAGEVLALESHALRDRGSEGTIRQLAEIAAGSWAGGHGPQGGRGRLLGMGVAIAGLVDARQGLVYDCFPVPGWEEVPLKRRLEEELGAESGPPILVEDRVRCMAVAEKRYGVARDLGTFLYVDLGSGVGSCFFLDNRIYRGKNGIAGELGHVPVKEDGPQCNCGNRGCLEMMVSTGSLKAAVKSSLESNVYTQLKGGPGQEVSLEEIAAAAGQGDKLASLLLFQTSELIGVGLADVVSVFDPGAVILAGEVVRGLGPLLVEGVVRTVRLRGIHPITQRTRFLSGSLIPHLGAWGAATMPLEHWLGSGILNV